MNSTVIIGAGRKGTSMEKTEKICPICRKPYDKYVKGHGYIHYTSTSHTVCNEPDVIGAGRKGGSDAAN